MSRRRRVPSPSIRPLSLLLLAALCGASCAEVSAPTGGERPEDEVAFVNVNLIPMTAASAAGERVVPAQTVLVRDGRIDAIGPADAIDVPSGARRIDAAGQYLVPGLAEMHGHLPSPSMPAQVTEDVLFLYVANGVTLVRGMQGNASQLELRERVESGELVGPRLVLGSPSMNGDSVTSVEDAERLVAEYRSQGFDLLKVHEGLEADVYDAIATTANELGIPFGGHVTDHVGLFHAIESGQTTVDHLDNFVQALIPDDRKPSEPPGLRGIDKLLDRVDESRMGLVTEAMLREDTSVVPTMVLWESGIFPTRSSAELLEERDETRYMPKETVDAWIAAVEEALSRTEPEAMRELAAVRRRILAALHEGGVRVLLGTDSPQIFSVPGFSIHREMKLYTEVGMTPYEILEIGTRVVGEYLEMDLGTVEVGRRADLLLLAANPLDDIGNVQKRVGVMADGHYLPEEEIQVRLSEIASHYPR